MKRSGSRSKSTSASGSQSESESKPSSENTKSSSAAQTSKSELKDSCGVGKPQELPDIVPKIEKSTENKRPKEKKISSSRTSKSKESSRGRRTRSRSPKRQRQSSQPPALEIGEREVDRGLRDATVGPGLILSDEAIVQDPGELDQGLL